MRQTELEWVTKEIKNNTYQRLLQKRMEFLQKCLWLTIETMTDIDLHILVQLLQVEKNLAFNKTNWGDF